MNRITFARFALSIVAVLTLSVFTAAAAAHNASPGPKPSPVVFLKRVITTIAANDYAQAWQSLHPVHQAVAIEEEYVTCEELSPIPGTLESLVPVRVRRRLVNVAGLPRGVRGVAVTFRLRFADRTLSVSASVRLTAAAILVDGRWTWILPRARYELYRDDACGT